MFLQLIRAFVVTMVLGTVLPASSLWVNSEMDQGADADLLLSAYLSYQSGAVTDYPNSTAFAWLVGDKTRKNANGTEACATSPANQIGWFRGENSADDSQGGNDATVEGGATFAAGKVGQGFSLDGIDDAVVLPNTPSLNSASRTVEAWINTQSLPGEVSTIYASRDPFVTEAFSVAFDGAGSLSANVRVATNPSNSPSFVCSAVNVIQPGNFQHVAVTYNSAGTGSLAAFVDGQPVQLDGAVELGGPIVAVSNHFIGKRQSGGSNPRYFHGVIDELSIYDRALGQFEIQSIFNAGASGKCAAGCVASPTNQVSLYRGENNAADSQGTNHGTLQNGVSFAQGRVGQAFSFDGVDDSVQLPLTQSFQNFTLEAWVRPLSAVSDSIDQELIFGQASAGAQIIVRPGTAGGVRVVIQYRDTPASFAQLTSNGDIPLNDWSYLVGTFDGASLKLFINGELNAQVSPANTTVQQCSTAPYFIGGFQAVTDCGGFTNPPFQFFNGLIDEAAVSSRALSQTEIQAIFAAGSVGKCDPAPLQIAPATSDVAGGSTLFFKASGASVPYTFSVQTNSSGGSIDSSTGVYTAGSAGGTDTVRVTDANGQTADGTVNVSAGCVPGQKTWDGGGSKNNWSEAANWTCDAVPFSTDIVVFDASSTKDATIDTSFFVRALRVNTGYVGTITENAGSLVRVGINDVITDSNFDSGTFNCASGGGFQLFNTFYTQAAGTFDCQNGSFTENGGSKITLNGGTFNAPAAGIVLIGQYNQTGGIFDCGTGTVENPSNSGFNLSGGHFDCKNGSVVSTVGTINLTGGTFDLPSGTATFGFENGGSQIVRGPAAVLNHNNGNVILHQGTFTFIGASQDFNNVTVRSRSNNIRGTMRVLGALDLQSGSVADDSSTGFVEVLGSMTVAQAYSAAGSAATFRILGNTTRTITLPTGMASRFNPFVLNAPNTTVSGSGPGQLQFSAGSLQSGIITGNGADIELGLYAQSGGTFSCGGGLITTTSNHILPFTGGTFDCTTSNVESSGGTFDVTGGTFKMPAGTFKLGTVSQCSLNIASGVTLDTSGGTLDLVTGVTRFDNGLGTREFNNVTTRNATIVGTLRVLGTLNMETGFVRNGVLEAVGPVNISNTYGEHPGTCCGENRLRLSGNAIRTVTIPSTIPARFQALEINAPNTIVQIGGTGSVPLSNVTLDQGKIETLAASMEVMSNGAGGLFTQNGGEFAGGGGNLLFRDRLVLNGGIFNSGAGNLELSNSGFSVSITLNGGSFIAPAGTLTMFAATLSRGAAAIFNHNNGTLLATGTSSRIDFTGGATSIDLNNLVVNINANNRFSSANTVRVLGNVELQNGSLGGNTFEAHKDVTVSPGFTDIFPFSDDPADIVFAGGNAQTFINNGGVNPSGSWTVNKPPGSTLTAATSFIQSLAPGIGAMPFNIASGTLFLANGSNFSTTGLLTIGSDGRLVSDSSTTITLQGDVTNSGVIDLEGGGAGCPQTDSILIRSSVNGTQRSWSGPGQYLLSDVNVRDMAGPTGSGNTTKVVFSGTDGGNNNPSWQFSPGCPATVSLSPGVAGVPTGQSQNFVAAGGSAPYTFSIPVNNSGATIDPTTGVYTAGAPIGTIDTVRVTDGFGRSADAVARVLGPPTQLGFERQPGNTQVGQVMTPTVNVAVRDGNGHTITNSVVSITLSFNQNPSGGTLSGTLTRNTVDGIARFDDLSINRVGHTYSLNANASGFPQAGSGVFDIVAGPPARVGFISHPSNATSGSIISPPVTVAIQDALGNTVTTATNPVTISIGNSPGAQGFTGNLTRSAVGGIATFSNLSITGVGNGYTLRAASGSLSQDESDPFNVVSELIVTNTNDDGPGSLRIAILSASVPAPGTRTIGFDIPGPGPHTIALASELPALTQPTSIDGRTQTGFAGAPKIELTAATGVTIQRGLRISSGCSVKGLVINRFFDAISVTGNGAVIQGNYIGTDLSGNAASFNISGIQIAGSNHLIGGNNAAARNVLSGNNQAVSLLNGSNISILGNYIGTNASGSALIGNHGPGIVTGTSNPGLLISGNVISGGRSGIFLGSSSVTISNNLIGLDAAGTTILGNALNGITFNSTQRLVRNRVTGNRIAGSAGLGISFSNVSGPTPFPNDPLDGDIGSNDLQNHPVLTSAASFPGNTSVSGSLNSRPSQSYTLEFFSSPSCDNSGHGEGETFLGSTQVTTDTGGITGFTASLPVTTMPGRFITATATDTQGNTSEFSQCRQVTAAAFSIAGFVRDGAGNPVDGATIRRVGTDGTESAISHSNGFYIFYNLPGGSNQTLTASNPSTVFSPANRTYTNLSAIQTAQDFTATSISRISGQVLSLINGSTFASGGITVNLSGAGSLTTQTDVNGNYSFNAVPNGNYVVTPSRTGFSFSPTSTPLNVAGDRTADFSTSLSEPLGGRLLKTYVDISAMNADGSNDVFMFNNTGGYASGIHARVAYDAKLSRDGSKIAYIEANRETGGIGAPANKKIFIQNFDGSDNRLIYTYPLSDTNPIDYVDWSPDGAKLVFTRSQKSLRTIDIDGSHENIVLTAAANEGFADPQWSPDGSTILFTSNSRTISVVEINGTGRTALTTGTFDRDARWSPDGTKIAFIRRAALNGTGSIFTMNADGSGQTGITTGSDFINVLWSPDGAHLAFTKVGPLPTRNSYGVIRPNGADEVVIRTIAGGVLSWAPIFTVPTQAGTNVQTTVGAAEITFSGVTGGGTTTITPIPSYSAGPAPSAFNLGHQIYEIATTASIVPPITVCLTMPSDTTASFFSRQSLLHRENGVWVDRTTSRDFPTRRICGVVSSLSPFAVAEQIDAGLPSITGLVLDAGGTPMVNTTVSLTGAESRTVQTDSNGAFSFINLTAGANYNVQPRQVGYMFADNNRDFLNLAGEETVLFEGAAENFQISGRVFAGDGSGLSNVTIDLDGATQRSVQTDGDGNYSFTGLPANGFYLVTPSAGAGSFSPESSEVSPLTSNFAGVDFQVLAPTAAGVSVSGRILKSNGQGLGGAVVRLADQDGRGQSFTTGPFGYFMFEDVPAGRTFIISVRSKQYSFAPKLIVVKDELTGIELIGSPAK